MRPALLTRLTTTLTAVLPGKSGAAQDLDLLPVLARKDATVFLEAREKLPALRVLPPDIDSYETLQKRYDEKSGEQPVVNAIFGPETAGEIKENLSDVFWQAPFTTTIWGALGFVAGWASGGILGGALGTVLDLPLAASFGDAMSCAFIPTAAYLATRHGLMWSVSENSREQVAFRHVAPFTALAAGAAFLATRLHVGFKVFYADPSYLLSVLALSATAAFGASLVGSVAAPGLSRFTGSVKARYAHWSDTRTLKKALRAFEKMGLSAENLTEGLTDTKRLAAFADGPLKAYLTEERDKLRVERDVLKGELARVTAGKERKVLFKDQTPAPQRERILAKLERTEQRLREAIQKLETDGIAVFENILDRIPKLLRDIREWDTDQDDVTELAALETLAETGEDKADDAEIMLQLSRERLGALASRFQAMIADIRASRQATLEVERLSSSLRERPQIAERADFTQVGTVRQREAVRQTRLPG